MPRRKNVEPRKVECIPTICGSTFFRGDNSISQGDCQKFFRFDIFPLGGDRALVAMQDVTFSGAIATCLND